MKWEYLFSYFNRETFEVPDGEPEPAGAYTIHELGDKEWELISVSGWQMDKAVALWKREYIYKPSDEEMEMLKRTLGL